MKKCKYGAPFFAFGAVGKSVRIAQGCCNHWDCPRCGELRAKMEYGRIVQGISDIGTANALYFITFTCRGRDTPREEALEKYGVWTNTVLTALRKDAKKRGLAWHYVQVTELQKRGHPHSHILTTYYPDDLVMGWVDKWNVKKKCYEPVEALRSEYLQARVKSSGLGEQYDISEVRTAAAAARYVAKYMFKGLDVQLPRKWKRVRYSQGFPQLPDKRDGTAWVLLSQADWDLLSGFFVLYAEDEAARAAIVARYRAGDAIIKGVGSDEYHKNLL